MFNRQNINFFKFLVCFSTIFSIISINAINIFAIEAIAVTNANCAYLYNIENNKVLYEKNTDTKIYPASTVKIMTGLLAVEYFGDDLTKMLTVPAEAVAKVAGVNIKLAAGEIISVGDLLHALIVGGANDAANVVAYLVSGSIEAFVEKMNQKAIEIGATSTIYKNPSGMHDDGMFTTTQDIAKISLYAYKLNTYMDISSVAKYDMPATQLASTRTIYNRNYLIARNNDVKYYLKEARGLNAGSTPQGGNCLVTTAQKKGLTYLCIIMGGDQTSEGEISTIYSYVEAKKLINWAFDSYDYIKVVNTSDIICEIPVNLSSSVDHVTLMPEKGLELYLPSDIEIKKDIIMSWKVISPKIDAPVQEGQVAGMLTLTYEDKIIGNINLIAKNNVDRSEFLYFLSKIETITGSRWFFATMISLVVFSIAYVFASAASRYKRNRTSKYKQR